MNGSSDWPARGLRGALLVAVGVHVLEQSADVLGDQVALQRPRGVGVSDREREFGTPRASFPCSPRVRHVELLAVHADLHAAEEQQVQPGGRDHDVGVELGPEAELDPFRVNLSIRSWRCWPALRIARNRSPSGPAQPLVPRVVAA